MWFTAIKRKLFPLEERSQLVQVLPKIYRQGQDKNKYILKEIMLKFNVAGVSQEML